MSNQVELEPYEVAQAFSVGMNRYLQSVLRNHQPAAGCEIDWNITMMRDIIGAAGELAFAKGTRQFWSGSVGTYKAGDVGETQIRTVDSPNKRLLVRDADTSEDRFVLVRLVEKSRLPKFRLVGWVWGHEAKARGHREAPNGRPACYFVPDEDLRPLRLGRGK